MAPTTKYRSIRITRTCDTSPLRRSLTRGKRDGQSFFRNLISRSTIRKVRRTPGQTHLAGEPTTTKMHLGSHHHYLRRRQKALSSIHFSRGWSVAQCIASKSLPASTKGSWATISRSNTGRKNWSHKVSKKTVRKDCGTRIERT